MKYIVSCRYIVGVFKTSKFTLISVIIRWMFLTNNIALHVLKGYVLFLTWRRDRKLKLVLLIHLGKIWSTVSVDLLSSFNLVFSTMSALKYFDSSLLQLSSKLIDSSHSFPK